VRDANEHFQSQIRIVGPTFSGSAASLRNALEDWRRFSLTGVHAREKPSIRVISGTATGLSGKALAGERDDPSLPSITFNTVQIPDHVLWEQIPHILSDVADVSKEAPTASVTADSSPSPKATPAPPRIAVLHEDTAYGRGAKADKRTGAEDQEDKNILRMTFPLHISELRTAYKGDQSKGSSAPDLGRHDLDLPDEAGQVRKDVIQPFSPRAAIYDELVLSNLLTTIRREDIRYVGITATDVEDLVFLVQQIRAYCPDTVVFTTSSDIRFLHSEVNTDLRGTLLFTTYPLFGPLQKWTSPFDRDGEWQIFPSDSAHGVYNATLAQLDSRKPLLDYGDPLVKLPPCPVVQIGVVGRDDIWPVAFRRPKLAEKDDVLAPRGAASYSNATGCEADLPVKEDIIPEVLGGIYPPAFEFLFVLLNVGFFVFALVLLIGEVYVRRNWSALAAQPTPNLRSLVRRHLARIVDERWWLNALLAKSPGAGFAAQRRLYVMFFSIGMLLAEIVGLGFALLPAVVIARAARPAPSVFSFLTQFVWSVFFAFGWPRGVVFGFEILTALLVLAVAIFSTIRMFRSFVRWPVTFWWVIVAASPIGLALWFILHQWTQTPLSFALYTFLRAAHLHSGVSPLTPLIFLAVAGFALVAGSFWRVAMLEDRPLPSLIPDDVVETASFRGVVARWKRVATFLENSMFHVPGAWLLVLLLFAGFTYFWFGKVYSAFSIDGRRFDLLFILLGFGVYAMFSFALLRFTFTWIALRQLLHRLYFHPSRYSYKNLQLAAQPTHFDRQKIRLYESRPGLTAVEYGLGCVRAMLRIAKRKANPSWPNSPPNGLVADIIQAGPALEATLGEAEGQLDDLLKAINWTTAVSKRKSLYAKMATLTAMVMALFEPVWRKDPGAPLLDVNLNPPGDKATTDRMLVDQAELFVASRVGDFVRNVFPHLINLIGFAMPAVLAMVLAVSSYPFPAHDTLLWVSWTILLATVAISLYVFISINRNPIISMFSGTDPGQFNWDNTFTMHLVLFAVIPILTLLGAQFPQALSGTVSWIGSVFGGGGNG